MTYLKIDHVDKVFSRGNRETEVLKAKARSAKRYGTAETVVA